MKSQLLIPDKLRVGYVHRADTFTQKLAYVIYYDKSGKLCKEPSFEKWRDKSIEVQEFENKPHSGFVLNKDVKRSSEWFGNGRNMIRIYDDRGMEFEITTGNLLFILMTTNCHKRGLEGEFVYAWSGKDLILLPTGCEEYTNSVEFTDLKTKSVKMKNLIPGCAYKAKTQEDLIYVGKFDWFNPKPVYHPKWLRNVDFINCLIFYNTKDNVFLPLNDLKTLAVQLSDIPVSNHGELIDNFYKSINGSKIVALTSEPLENVFDITLDTPYQKYYKERYKLEDDKATSYMIHSENVYDAEKKIYGPSPNSFNVYKSQKISISVKGGLKLDYCQDRYGSGNKVLSAEQVQALNFEELYLNFESGAKHKYSELKP